MLPTLLISQENQVDTLLLKYKNCNSNDCKLLQSFKLSEFFLETDEIENAQSWLDSTKTFHFSKTLSPMDAYIHSLQSELFYYIGLYQFGVYEAQKSVDASIKLNDSVLMADAYFFKGINEFEMNDISEAYSSLSLAKRLYPRLKTKKHLRTLIQDEHIHNNIAQLFLKTKDLDSSFYYNTKAYTFAKSENSKRGIPNCEQTFGLIYLAQNKQDSAVFYLRKSTNSAFKSSYYDIMLIDQGFLAETFQQNQDSVKFYFQKGLKIMDDYPVNQTFRRLFFTTVLPLFQKQNDSEKLSFVQDKIIQLDSEIRSKGNLRTQHITEQYIANENKLLNLEILKLKDQKRTSFLQITILSLGVLVMLLIVILYRRKTRIQETLLHQKNEISKDLHDDIGSGLSSILIHADVLSKQPNTNENQKMVLAKIASTGKDISQRMNAFIWSLNTENNNLRNFCEYIKHYASNLLDGTPIALEFEQHIKDADHIFIEGHYRKHLFLCMKEILNNALKHSEATRIGISILHKEKHRLKISIQDNGKGITQNNAFGNGLKNVEKRVEDMQGEFEILNENGLTLEITITLAK